MPVLYAKAPGKIILFGEHAVVYGQPAIAIPVTRVNATARVLPILEGLPGQIRIQAPDIALDAALTDLPETHPLAAAVRLTLEAVNPKHIPALTVQFTSSIPISAGMGSSAATSVALIRALSAYLGKPLPASDISTLAYEIEKIYHGTPSGIDNNVIAHQRPVFFRREQPIDFLSIENPTHWIIADTGEKTPTRETVTEVRNLYETEPQRYGAVFDQIGDVVQKARQALIEGDLGTLGWLLDENQRLLEELTVSSHRLDALIEAAKNAGAAGAKLSGGGRGGNMIALATPEKTSIIEQALIDAGAHHTLTTLLNSQEAR